MIPTLVGVPIKPFGVAKARLATVLDAPGRARLGRQVAAHTAETVLASGAAVAIVTGDDGVARWAMRRGWPVIPEIPGEGLDGAGRALVAAADGPWAFLHADLPILRPDDLAESWRALDATTVIAPSHDGGTSLIAGHAPFEFSFGPGSFRRHLAAAPSAAVIALPGLALDLDTARDLAVAASLPSGAWLEPLLRRHALVTG